MTRPCPSVPGFACPTLPGLECPSMPPTPSQDQSWDAKAAYCRMEARRAGLAVPEPGEKPPKRYRK